MTTFTCIRSAASVNVRCVRQQDVSLGAFHFLINNMPVVGREGALVSFTKHRAEAGSGISEPIWASTEYSMPTRGDDIAHCAFAYSYGNYCRPSFTDRALRYGALPKLDDGRALRSIVGGTGIAVTARCADTTVALDYALFTGSAWVQSGIYTLAGGQPSRREAWVDKSLEALTGGFFRDALPDQEHCIVRPRYDGYVPLQEEGGTPLQHYLRGEWEEGRAWDEINKRYRSSIKGRNKTFAR